MWKLFPEIRNIRVDGCDIQRHISERFLSRGKASSINRCLAEYRHHVNHVEYELSQPSPKDYISLAHDDFYDFSNEPNVIISLCEMQINLLMHALSPNKEEARSA